MELVPERLVAGGDALAHDEAGRVVFVPGALPGETVEVEIISARKDFARARLVAVAEPSPHRREPPCRHRLAGCGGCDWMHIEPAAQRDAKLEIVRESLRRIGRVDPAVVERVVRLGASVPEFGYRTTIRVVGAPDGGVGFRGQATDAVVPVTSCPVADPALSRTLSTLEADPAVEVTLRTSAATGAMTAWWERRRGTVRGLAEGTHAGERAWLTELIDGHDLAVSARSFFQSGARAAEVLVAAVRAAAPELADAVHAVDAYGGVGLFATTLMAKVAHVTLIESSAAACRDAVRNLGARTGDGRTFEVIRSDVASWAPSTDAAPVDVIVADPSRPGLAKPGVGALTAPGAPVLVLVSCDPVSLARDVALLADAGYTAEAVEVLDLFPNTHHVETVTRFVR